MGIKQLSKLIKENTKNAIKIRKFQFYQSQVIAIDASMSIYQFLIAVRSDGSNLNFNDQTTSHLIGLFYRTIRLLEANIVPVYVFDGKAPASKVYELEKRLKRREEASKKLEQAELEQDLEKIEKYKKMNVKVEPFHIEECKRLLTLMGIPFVEAPSEAEAYCAFLCKNKCVDGVATEDMDTLCFGSPLLLRNLNAAKSKKLLIEEYNLKEILEQLNLDFSSFVDLCILLGCDYTESIKGIGLKRSFELIKEHKSIENILKSNPNILSKNEKPFEYQKARDIFLKLSEIGEKVKFELKPQEINLEKVVEFLCGEKGFDEKRVKSGMEKILKGKKIGKQMKLDNFFRKK